MKNLYTLLSVVLILNLTSCIDFKTKKDSSAPDMEDFNTVTANEEYQVSIPKFMRGTTGLNDEASLQYQNIFKETYVIVIDEPKTGFIDVLKDLGSYDENQSLIQNYRDVQLQLLSSTMQFQHQSEPTSMKINGLDAEWVEVDALVDGIEEDIAYFLTFFDGGDNVYMMMAWTLGSKKEEHKKTFEAISQSFKLID